ncbi:LuxR family transcriptional regulator (plasmid) [Rhizobium sp. CB3060]|uniref:LuxR family transcriptional regulator n=1 Tax=Rhizobium sp. CB3060 TaxID=3138255 RepID=UPI0021A476ED|nr:LuxR family transcriptional regulator [Rhizobium tropici]UWU25817.1 LuxR family transcriptional regulator [Rhizobium tropici]
MERPRMDGVSQFRRSARVSIPHSLISSMPSPKLSREAFSVEFCQFVEQTHGADRADHLFELLFDFAISFGCLWIAYDPFRPNQTLIPASCNKEMMLNYPDEWLTRYSEMGYGRIDPIIKKSRKRICAFRWSELYNDASTTEMERRIFDEAATFGLRSGISVPMHGPASSFAIMSFAHPWECEFDNMAMAYLQLAAVHFHLELAKIPKPSCTENIPDLSSRERECILWVARGKSSWDIGIILGISNNTVDFHIKNAMRKLDVTSRTVAAVKALNSGIIEL